MGLVRIKRENVIRSKVISDSVHCAVVAISSAAISLLVQQEHQISCSG